MNKSNGARESVPRAAVRNMADLIHDLVTLAELQRRLLVLDVQEATGRVVAPLIIFAIAGLLAISCVPLLFVAVALSVAQWTSLSLAASFWITLAFGLVIVGVLFAVAYARLKSRPGTFERSKNEFAHNVQWFKATLRRIGSSSDRGPRESAATDWERGAGQ